MFYPDVKPHISPSAFAQWFRQPSLFVRSYFKGEKTPETAAMKAGKKIHALIEAGFIQAQHRFNCWEKELVVEIPGGVKVLGRPDSHEIAEKELVSFVDYKTGKDNHWTKEELAVDLKMRLTAWLVLQANPGARNVRGVIEWFGTQWDGKELVPTGEPSVCVDYVYTWEELFPMGDILQKAIKDINEAYEAFLAGSDVGDLVEEADVVEYAELERQKELIETRQKEIKERVGQALEFSGKKNFEHELGSFYVTVRKTFEYPKDLKLNYLDMGLMLADAEEIEAAASAVKKNWELDHEPVKVSKSVGFKPKKK